MRACVNKMHAAISFVRAFVNRMPAAFCLMRACVNRMPAAFVLVRACVNLLPATFCLVRACANFCVSFPSGCVPVLLLCVPVTPMQFVTPVRFMQAFKYGRQHGLKARAVA